MKNIFLLLFVFKLLVPLAFSQDGDHIDGGRFSKNIEYNILRPGIEFDTIKLEAAYNLNSKGDVEKLLFGDFNAPVEFFYEPTFEGASGFRIVRDKLKDSYFIEIKYVSNFEEARDEASKKYPMRGLSLYEMTSLSEEDHERIRIQNSENMDKYFEERNNLFKIESRTFSIIDQFAEKMHEVMVSIIDNFKARGVPPIINDGYSVTFRNVVDDEVWSLRIHIPQGRTLIFSDFCRKIIDETLITVQLDESKYIKSLNEFLLIYHLENK